MKKSNKKIYKKIEFAIKNLNNKKIKLMIDYLFIFVRYFIWLAKVTGTIMNLSILLFL